MNNTIVISGKPHDTYPDSNQAEAGPLIVDRSIYERPDLKPVAEHFDGAAKGYREGSGKVQWLGPQYLTARLAHIINGTPVEHHLDLGAGTGEVSALLKQHYSNIYATGVDASQNMLQRGLHDGSLNEARVADATQLGWRPDNHDDVVTVCGVFDFLSADQIPAFAQEIVRVLKPGGVFGFTFEPTVSENPGPKANNRHDAKTLCGLFEKAGANIIEVTALDPAWLLGKKRRPVENQVLIGRAPQLH